MSSNPLKDAVDLYRAGRLRDAQKLAERCVKQTPDHPEVRRLLATILADRGDLAGAMAQIEVAIELAPAHLPSSLTLADIQQRRGALEDAAATLSGAIATFPSVAALHSNLGTVLMGLRRPEAAIASFTEALRLDPQFTDALHNLALALLGQADLGGAAQMLERYLRSVPDDADAHYQLGLIHISQRHPGVPEHLSAAIDLNPAETRYRFAQVRALSGQPDADHLVSLKPVLLDRFADADLDPSPLIEPAATLLSMEPSFPLLGPAGYSGDLTHDTLSEYLPALSQPLVLAMLTGGVTHGSQLEDLLRDLRTALLDAAVHGHLEALPESVDELLVALATQAWLNEYLWSCSDEERQRVGRLGTEPRSRLVAACYRQLDAEDAALLAAHGSDRAQALIAEQIEAAAERDRIAADMPRLGGIVDETSLRVQAQYEVNPYPRLQRANRLTPRPLHYELTSALPAIDPDELPDSDHPAILIAGCGTGQHVVETATRYSGAEVTAIDLSAASLAFAQQRVQRMGLDVRFMQADILDLGELGERFDLIESAGVLHHMADPEAGWRVLTGLLADDGVMRIALYSELARRSVVTARGMFDPLPQTADEIRAARDQIRALPQDHPAFDVTSSRDFYSLSMCRDLLFHSQEHRFTIPELAATIDRLGLEFLGFELPPGVGEAYKARFPDDPTMRDLSNWDAFEQTEPGTFGAMYQFLVRRR